MRKLIVLSLSLFLAFYLTANASGFLSDLQNASTGDISPDELKERYKDFELHVDDSAHIRYTLGSFSYSLPVSWVSSNEKSNEDGISARYHYPTEEKIADEGYLLAGFLPLDEKGIESLSAKETIRNVAAGMLDSSEVDQNSISQYKWTSIDGYDSIYFTYKINRYEKEYTVIASITVNENSAFYVEYLNRHLSGLDREHDFLEFLLSISVETQNINYDYSSMSLAELAKAKEKINKAMWETDEWQEVTVPAGVYKIGEHIPAGYWTITAKNYAIVTWGKALDESKTDMEYSDKYASEFIDIDDDVKSVSWDLFEDTYLIVESGDVIFTPFAGISLGFK